MTVEVFNSDEDPCSSLLARDTFYSGSLGTFRQNSASIFTTVFSMRYDFIYAFIYCLTAVPRS